MADSGYRPRLIDATAADLFAELPALMITGPRAAGKTTTAARLAASIVRLDRPRDAELFLADPDVALETYDEPILLDEWQEVPAVLGAVKRAVDLESRPGRFLLTGSVRADLQAATWPGTGRVVRAPMHGMTVREILNGVDGPSPVDLLASTGELHRPSDPPDLRGYIDLALQSGFPDPALSMKAEGRRKWLQGYVDQLITRDAIELEPRRDPSRMRRYLEAYALNTAGIAAENTLLRAAEINRRTATAYERLLSDLFVVESMPAWSSNRLRRLSRGPKRYFLDPAIAAAALKMDADTVLRDGDMLGRLLDTFVTAQLRAECTHSSAGPTLYHLREEHGRREVDVVAELGMRGVIAFEVKATAAPDRDTSRHLAWLKDRLGDRFLAGVVFHTGRFPIKHDERIVAAPIASLWA